MIDEIERRILVRELMSGLPDDEWGVVWLYYFRGLPFSVVGMVLGFHESWGCVLHGRALERMRRVRI
jgi:DNA-directed RNA polymerase specialized sigma subunit